MGKKPYNYFNRHRKKSGKIQHSFMIKTLQIWCGRILFLIWSRVSLKKGKKGKLTTNITLNGEIQKTEIWNQQRCFSSRLSWLAYFLFPQGQHTITSSQNLPGLGRTRLHFPPMCFPSSLLTLISLCSLSYSTIRLVKAEYLPAYLTSIT